MSPIQQLPQAVNYHINRVCNENCPYCFATFKDDAVFDPVHRGLPPVEAEKIITELAHAGFEKINFAGGEPTLYPKLPQLLRLARKLGLVTSIVSNGARLPWLLQESPGDLDWVGLSVDSACEATQQQLGRGKGQYVAGTLENARLLHSAGINLKLNTVVTAINHREDMSDFILQVNPSRWKIFQFLPVAGQNDQHSARLLVTPEEFDAYVSRHRHLEQCGISLAPESNEDMTGSYAMIDPAGRFFSDVGGRHSYSTPILEVGVNTAFQMIKFNADTFERRGGNYNWGSPGQRSVVQLGIPTRPVK
jgi:radical S-adenosyl methionine domain-containing protein 2